MVNSKEVGMSVYSIKDLEHLSGIKAHTIRIWEQRYSLFSPQRTDTNIRFYSDEDLKLILNIATLKNNGFKISKIVEMPADLMFEEIRKVSASSQFFEDQINALTVSMIDMNESMFVEVLKQNTNKYGFEKAMMNIIYPFMRKIGILWLTNSINPAQEHFISHLVRQKLIAATDNIEIKEDAPLFLLFLPEGELHELGILFANFMIRSQGLRTIFFGQSVPLNALEEVYHQLNPKYLMTALTTAPESDKVQGYIDALGSKFKEVDILITGGQVVGQDIQVPENMTVLPKFEDLNTIIEKAKLEVSGR